MASATRKSLVFMNLRGLSDHISAVSRHFMCYSLRDTFSVMLATDLYAKRAIFGLIALGMLVATASTAFAQDATTLKVRPLVRDGQVLVTFSVDGGLTDEM